MKTPEEIDKLTIQKDESIVDKMTQAILNFQMHWCEKPVALILSPYAFLQLECWMRENHRFHSVESKFEFSGVELICADTDKFITCAMSPKLAAHYQYKLEKGL